MPDEHSLYVTVKPNTMKSKENNNAGLGLLLATFLVVQLPASLFPLIFPPYFTGKVSTRVNLVAPGRRCSVACIFHLAIK